MFLTDGDVDGELKVGKHCLYRYSGHARPNRSKKATVTIDIDIDGEPNLSEISSDEWTSSDSSEAELSSRKKRTFLFHGHFIIGNIVKRSLFRK